MKWWIIVIFGVGTTWADIVCDNIRTQDLDLDGIMGKWYVIEILNHRPSPTLSSPTSIPRTVLDTCPIVRIRQDQKRDLLRLVWTEEEGDIEYTFNVPDKKRRPGRWISQELQNGSLATDPRKEYVQFGGSVHVIKAVKKEMLLTFCSGQSGNQLYSILLGREHILERGTKSIHDLLARHHLIISTIQSTCAKGSGLSIKNNHIHTIIGILSLIILRYFPISFNSNNW